MMDDIEQALGVRDLNFQLNLNEFLKKEKTRETTRFFMFLLLATMNIIAMIITNDVFNIFLLTLNLTCAIMKKQQSKELKLFIEKNEMLITVLELEGKQNEIKNIIKTKN